MNKTVLIVEDEFIIAMALQLLLEGHGWTVIGPAANVKAALALLQGELPSAAVLDVNLGNELVTSVAETLKAKGVPFAVASAYDKPELIGGDVLAGIMNVGKPTPDQRLLLALAELTGA